MFLRSELIAQRSTRPCGTSGYGEIPDQIGRDRRSHPSDGEGFVVVYSITNRSTFQRVERIVDRVHLVKEENADYLSSPSSSSSKRTRVPVTIVGNKRDQFASRQVSTDEARALAQRMGCEFFETSAKTNTNVESAFKSVVRAINTSRKGGSSRGGVAASRDGSTGTSTGGNRKKRQCVIL